MLLLWKCKTYVATYVISCWISKQFGGYDDPSGRGIHLKHCVSPSRLTHTHADRQTNLKNTHGKVRFNHLLPCCCGDYSKMSLRYRVCCVSASRWRWIFESVYSGKKMIKHKHSCVRVNKNVAKSTRQRLPDNVERWTFMTCDGSVEEAKRRRSPPLLVRKLRRLKGRHAEKMNLHWRKFLCRVAPPVFVCLFACARVFVCLAPLHISGNYSQ